MRSVTVSVSLVEFAQEAMQNLVAQHLGTVVVQGPRLRNPDLANLGGLVEGIAGRDASRATVDVRNATGNRATPGTHGGTLFGDVLLGAQWIWTLTWLSLRVATTGIIVSKAHTWPTRVWVSFGGEGRVSMGICGIRGCLQ